MLGPMPDYRKWAGVQTCLNIITIRAIGCSFMPGQGKHLIVYLKVTLISIFFSILELWEYHHLVEHLLKYAISGLHIKIGERWKHIFCYKMKLKSFDPTNRGRKIGEDGSNISARYLVIISLGILFFFGTFYSYAGEAGAGIHIHSTVYSYAYSCVYICLHNYVYFAIIAICVHVRRCRYKSMYVYIYICIYIYTYIYIYKHV